MALFQAATDTGVLRAASGQETETQTNAGPGTYDGRFSVQSKLGRVDEFTVQSGIGDSQANWEARAEEVTSVGTGAGGQNVMVIRVFSQTTAVEAPNDADLSSIDFTTVAYRL